MKMSIKGDSMLKKSLIENNGEIVLFIGLKLIFSKELWNIKFE